MVRYNYMEWVLLLSDVLGPRFFPSWLCVAVVRRLGYVLLLSDVLAMRYCCQTFWLCVAIVRRFGYALLLSDVLAIRYCCQTFWRTGSFLLGYVAERAFKDEHYVELCSFPRPDGQPGL